MATCGRGAAGGRPPTATVNKLMVLGDGRDWTTIPLWRAVPRAAERLTVSNLVATVVQMRPGPAPLDDDVLERWRTFRSACFNAELSALNCFLGTRHSAPPSYMP